MQAGAFKGNPAHVIAKHAGPKAVPLVCNLGDMTAGDWVSFQVSVVVDADAMAPLTNAVTVGSDASDSNTFNNSFQLVTGLAPLADLKVTKISEPHTTVQAGETFTYTIFVDNLGPSVARNVVITDTLLNEHSVTIQSCAFSVSQGGGAITQFTCTTGPVVSTQFGTNVGVFKTNMLDPLSFTSPGRLRASFRLVANEALDVMNETRSVAETPDPDMSNNFALDAISVTAVSDLRLTKTATGEEQQVNQPGLIFNNAIPGQAFPTAPNYFASTRVTAGRRIQYTLTVTNNGPSTAENVMLSDRLPPGVQIYQGSLTAPAGVNCQTGTPGEPLDRMTCGLGTIASGGSKSVSFQVVTAASLAAGTVLENDAYVTSDIFDPDNGNNLANTQNTVLAAADISVLKTAAGTVVAGNILRYQIAVQNNGPSDALNVTIKDTLPANYVKFLWADGATCRPAIDNQNILFCSLGNMTAGGRHTFDVYVQVDSATPDATPLQNCAAGLYSPSNTSPPGPPQPLPGDPDLPMIWDPFTTDNSSCAQSTALAQADLMIEKSVEIQKLYALQQFKYNITVTNLGPSDAHNVTVTDTLSPWVTYEIDTDNCVQGPPGTLTCTNGTLKPGETWSFSIWVHVNLGTPPGTEIINTACVSSTTPDPDLSNNCDTAKSLVLGRADLMVEKTGSPEPVFAGGILTYEIEVTNLGPDIAFDVKLVDNLPWPPPDAVDYLDFTIANGSGECVLASAPAVAEVYPLNTVVCKLGDMQPGAVAEVYLRTRVRSSVPKGDILHNVATVSTASIDLDATNNTDTWDSLVDTKADLAITKKGVFYKFGAGKGIDYKITVTNLGPSDAQNVVVVDTLPLTKKQVKYIFDSADGACVYDGDLHAMTCDFGTLSAGDQVTFHVYVKVKTSSKKPFTNLATVESTTFDPDLTNNTAREDLTLKKTPKSKR